MPPEKWKFRLRHILESMEKIQRYTAGMTFDSFRTDEKTVDAVINNLLIIGEAARHIPEAVQATSTEIPWPLMRGMRNVLVHEYDRINLPVVWKTVQDDLPPLAPLLRKVLEEAAKE